MQHDPVYLTRRWPRVAAVIDAEGDLTDIEVARAAREEIDGGQPAILWEDVKTDLGLA